MEPTISREEEFYKWLSGQVSAKQLSECYTAFKTINRHYQQYGFLKNDVFKTDDITVLNSILRDISKGKIFKRRYPKRQAFSKLGLTYYIRYVEKQNNEGNSVATKENSTSMHSKAEDVSNYLRTKETKKEFNDWLLQNETAHSESYIIKDLDLIDALLRKYKVINNSIYDIKDESELSRIINIVKNNDVIHIGIKKKLDNYVSALELYLDYLLRNKELHDEKLELKAIVSSAKKTETVPKESEHKKNVGITQKAIDFIRFTDQYQTERTQFQEWLKQEKYKEGTINIYIKALEKGSQYALLNGIIREEILLMQTDVLQNNYEVLYNNRHLAFITAFRTVLGAFCRYKKEICNSDKMKNVNKEVVIKTENYQDSEQENGGRNSKSKSIVRMDRHSESSGDSITAELIKRKIPYVDYRNKGGALWVGYNSNTEDFLEEFETIGIEFKYSAPKHQWWTRDTFYENANSEDCINRKPEASVVDENVRNVSVVSKHEELMNNKTPADKKISKPVSRKEALLRYGAVGKDSITERLLKNNIRFVDNRNKGGALSIDLSPQTDFIVEYFKKQGIEFRYSGNKHQWWTRDIYYEKSDAQEDNSQPIFRKDVRLRYGAVGKDSITERLFKNKIRFTDNRNKGGVLSIDLSPGTDFVVEYFKSQGVEIRYSANKHQWWTRDIYYEKSDAQEDNTQKNVVNDDIHISSPTTSDTKIDCATNMEQGLCDLLSNDEYSLLRKALVTNGILTLKAFEELNLWVFMNQNGLYNINQRYTIYDQLKKQSEKAKQLSQNYYLKTTLAEYTGMTPSEAFLHYCEYISQKAPLKFRFLIDSQDNITGKRVLKKYSNNSNDLQLNNPNVYIDGDLDSETALRYAKYVCTSCKDNDLPVSLEIGKTLSKNHETATSVESESSQNVVLDITKEEGKQEDKTNKENDVSQSNSQKPIVEIQHTTKTQKKVEQIVLNADIDGLTLAQLYIEVPSVSMVVLRQICENSPKIVDLQNKMVHVDAFIDFEDAAEELHELIEKLLNKNDGYVSASQLYEYAHSEMQMFLNDNDVDDERSVYCIARHLFSRVKWNGYRYIFTAGNHISRPGKDALYTNMDVIRKYAQDNGGFFEYDHLVRYLEKVGIKTGNLRGQMQIGSKPYFFYYSSDDIIIADSMHIDDSWFNQSQKALTRLFEDMGDHVVLRSINPIWYEQLPDLPGHRSWSPLLLQYVLKFYGKKVGARTIGTELMQRYDTVHSMLVSNQSEIQTFADTVIAYIVDNGIEQRHFEAEQLRRVLVLGGMITGGELFSHLPKAIGNDPRFAWDVAEKNVNIKV